MGQHPKHDKWEQMSGQLTSWFLRRAKLVVEGGVSRTIEPSEPGERECFDRACELGAPSTTTPPSSSSAVMRKVGVGVCGVKGGEEEAR